jgi:uncharacterized membrane protein
MNNIQFTPSAIDAGECVSGGWNFISRNYWTYFGMTTLLTLSSIVISCIPFVPILFQIFVVPAVTVGIFYALLREMRGEPVEFGMMFKGFENYVPAMLVGLINAIPQVIFTILSFALNLGQIATEIIKQRTGQGNISNFAQSSDAAPVLAGGLIIVLVIVMVVFFLFSIAWGITFYFALPILAEHNVTAIEAIKLSAKAGWSNMGGLIVLFIFEFLIALLGVIAICIGVFFVIPIIFAANAMAYRQVFPMIAQNFNYAPPPPTEYGFGGQS